MKRNKIVIISLIVICTLFLGYPTYFFIFNFSPDIKHDSDTWLLIEDFYGKRIAVESPNNLFWEGLEELLEGKSSLFVWGTIVPYDNCWKFRFDPSTVTIEGGSIRSLDANIRYIANNLEYLLYHETGINIKSLIIYEQKLPGLILVSIDGALFILSLFIVGLYLFLTRKEVKKIKSLRKLLKDVQMIPEGTSIEVLSQKTNLEEQEIFQIIGADHLEQKLGLVILEGEVFSRDIHQINAVNGIESELKNLQQIPQHQYTPEHYDSLVQFKRTLEDSLNYFENKSTHLETQSLIRKLLSEISSLLEALSFDELA